MATFQSDQIRNIALVGHRSSGKTSLAEAMLFVTGAIGRLGSVDGGNATTDFIPEEIDRKLSISPALCHVEHSGTKINIIDTPGYAEFYSEVVPCLWVADTAVVVLDGVAGVEVHTRKVFAAAKTRGLPIIAVVSKLDKEHSSFEKVIESLGTLPGCKAVAVQMPIGSEGSFSGVVDLLSMKALFGAGKEAKVQDIPADIAEEAQAARDALVEEVAGSDEALMEKFFENDALTPEELLEGLKKAVRTGSVVPVLCSGAAGLTGAKFFLDFVADVLPSPVEMPAWMGHRVNETEETVVACDTAAPLAAVIWKTMRDPFIGRLSLVRVISGEMRRDGQGNNPRSGQRERLTGLTLVNGKETSDCDGLCAGDMGCIGKLENSITGDSLCDAKNQFVFSMPALPLGMHTAAMRAESRADEDKLSGALSQVGEEDIGFTYERMAETGELIARGMGPLHLQIIKEQLIRKFKVAVELGEPEIPYRETARKSVRVQGRHKKQTGGRGQFGDVWIRLEPLEPGSGYEFVNGVSGGSVPTNYIPAVEKGIVDAMGAGPLARYPIVDVRVTLDDGSSHPVDSSDLAFRLAGQIAMRKAMLEAGPVLLEPVVVAEITCPDEVMGDVMSDLSGRRGRVQGTEPAGGGMVTVKALVPLGEMTTYSSDLTSMSQGRASYTMEMAHYEEVPSHQQEAIIARRKVAEEETE
ncbi:elongation factor G [bacterium]|nr:elongation factor G [bacterium]